MQKLMEALYEYQNRQIIYDEAKRLFDGRNSYSKTDTDATFMRMKDAYGAVEPLTGEHFFLVLPYANTICMNLFLKESSQKYPDYMILLGVDGAAWHKSKTLEIPDNIQLFVLLPYTPEMNPIEQICKEIRKCGFKNEIFHTLEKVVDRLCNTINSLSCETLKIITGRKWILSIVLNRK